jgi:hypothetical protein
MDVNVAMIGAAGSATKEPKGEQQPHLARL